MGNKLFKIMTKLQKNEHKPDLHSFTGNIKNGRVFVEARDEEIFIEEFRNNNENIKWEGTVIAATDKLGKLGIDIESIKI